MGKIRENQPYIYIFKLVQENGKRKYNENVLVGFKVKKPLKHGGK